MHQHAKAGAATLGAILVFNVAVLAFVPTLTDQPLQYFGALSVVLVPLIYAIARHFGIDIRS